MPAMELSSLENLEQQISRILDQYRQIKKDRDEIVEELKRKEKENNALKSANDDLAAKLEEAQRNVRDPIKEELVRAKVDELLAKLEGF